MQTEKHQNTLQKLSRNLLSMLILLGALSIPNAKPALAEDQGSDTTVSSSGRLMGSVTKILNSREIDDFLNDTKCFAEAESFRKARIDPALPNHAYNIVYVWFLSESGARFFVTNITGRLRLTTFFYGRKDGAGEAEAEARDAAKKFENVTSRYKSD